MSSCVQRFSARSFLLALSVLALGVSSSYGQAKKKKQISPERRTALQAEQKKLEQEFRRWQGLGNQAVAIDVLKKILAVETQLSGPDHPKLAGTLESMGQIHRHLKQWADSLKVRKQAFQILEKSQGKDHWQTVDAKWKLKRSQRLVDDPPFREQLARILSLDNSASKAMARRDIRGTLTALQQAQNMRIKVFGNEHPSTGAGYHNIGSLLTQLGQAKVGHQLLIRGLRIRQKTLGEDHPHTSASISNLAYCLTTLGRYREALPLRKKGLESAKRLRGEFHGDVATALNNLGYLLQQMGDLPGSRRFYQQSLVVHDKVFGRMHPQTALALNNLGGISMKFADYTVARSQLEEAVRIFAKTRQTKSMHAAATYNSLGALHAILGNYSLARTYYERSMGIIEKILGQFHPDTATTLINLGGIAATIGDEDTSEVYHQRALAVLERRLGKHPRTAECLSGLGSMLFSYDLKKAREYYVRALAIWREAVGEEHLSTIETLEQIAAVDVMLGDAKAAEARLTKVLQLKRKKLPEGDPRIGRTLAVMSGLEAIKKNPEAARQYMMQALSIYEKALGEMHPRTLDTVLDIGVSYFGKGDFVASRKYLERSLGGQLALAQQILPVLSEAEAMSHVPQLHFRRDILLSVLRYSPQVSAMDAYRWVWKTRGLASEAISHQRRVVHELPETRALAAKLRLARKQLAQLALAKPKPGQSERRLKRLRVLTQTKESLERELAATSSDYRRARYQSRAAVDELIQRLPDDVAVVEFVQTNARRGTPDDPAREVLEYDAFVIRGAGHSGSSVTWISLGPVTEIDKSIGGWRQQIATLLAGRGIKLENVPKKDDTPSHPEQALRKAIWDPIQPTLAGATTVLIVPDGRLTGIPWAALPGAKPDTLLVDQYALATAGSGHEIVATLKSKPKANRSNDGRLVVVGGVTYDPRGTPADLGQLASSSRAPRGDDVKWSQLPGTLKEAREIQGLARERSVLLLKGSQATEAELRKQLTGARFLHLATHGFFADEKTPSAAHVHLSRTSFFVGQHTNRATSIGGRNPFILSGIVLAGANRSQQYDVAGDPIGDDGILTAEEVVDLDLRKAEMVVLSACETGVGTVAGGEGVFGLQRAFAMAGAKSVVASLWKVDDQATQMFMTRFYGNLWTRRMGKLPAFREAQRWMRKQALDGKLSRGLKLTSKPRKGQKPTTADKNAAATAYWAAFTLSGDWR